MSDEKKVPNIPAVVKSPTTKYIIYAAAGLVSLVGLVTLIIYLIILPSKPVFTLQDITVSSFNVTTNQPYLLSSTMQVTISSRNTMSHVAILYREAELYATYRDEQFTFRYVLTQTFQEHNDVVVWSPYLEGHTTPISPIAGPALMQDLNFGAVLVMVKIEGRIKFRVGQWTSDDYRMYVHCPGMVRLGDMNAMDGFEMTAKEFKFQLVKNCFVEISR